MDETLRLALATYGSGTIMAAVNERLAEGDLSITREDALMLAERRAASLAETGRVEFGAPAVVAIAEALATSSCIAGDGVADILAELQDVFYALRDELSVDVPDAEIAEALRDCLEAEGDVAAVAVLSVEEVMAYSRELTRMQEAPDGAYRIVDDEGRVYAFDPAEWDYDEQAQGWEGEGWADDWDD